MLFYVVFAAFAAAFSVSDGKARDAKRQLFTDRMESDYACN